MRLQKPSIPSGTRDFGPQELSKRQYIISTIKKIYTLYGYQPIETPVMENLTTLTGKYGDEGDKLLFKILNSGDYLKNTPIDLLQDKNSIKVLSTIAEKGLRYDLTVPFARYVVMHQQNITFPFKRYQIQPVWRADRPQKGRYREFYQCDADVIGSNSLLNDAELVFIIRDVFEALKLNTTIRLNNRKILDGLSEYIGETEKKGVLISIIDRLDKIGIDGVRNELAIAQFTTIQIEKTITIIQYEGTNNEKIKFIETQFVGEKGQKGIRELKEVLHKIGEFKSTNATLKFDLTLARGLSYYTGSIYEVTCTDIAMGSILGGGRYDDLTGIFGLPNMSGVGISFGIDRIYDVLSELDLFPTSITNTSKVLIIAFNEVAEQLAIKLARALRKSNIATEIYPDLEQKIGKKFKFADDKKIPFALVIGEDELTTGLLTLKDLTTGSQITLKENEVIAFFNQDGKDLNDYSE